LSEPCPCEIEDCPWSDLLKGHAFGCWTLDIGGSLRHRFEHQDNFQVRRYGDPNASSDTFVLQRFRLDLDLKHQENWRTSVQFQDARPFGTIFSMDDFANGGNARLGYTFDAAWQPRVAVQYSFGSGDSDPDGGRDRTFDGLFGAIDSMYGWMNIFAWKNLRDYQATLNLKPMKKTEIVLDWHYF
jgi:hypothetical protein